MTEKTNEQQSPSIETEIEEELKTVEDIAQVAGEELHTELFPEDLIAEVNTLKEELQAAQAKADEYLDGWQRARAEFANYKKRVDRDQAQTYQNAVGSVVKRYLDAVDDLERALKNRPQDAEGASWAQGIELVYRKLLATMENDGVVAMKADGALFDPNLHEAVTSEANDDYESGQIIEVLQQGYLIGDRVLRPAMVRVAQ